jgi:hypothetical protein
MAKTFRHSFENRKPDSRQKRKERAGRKLLKRRQRRAQEKGESLESPPLRDVDKERATLSDGPSPPLATHYTDNEENVK